MSRAVEVALAAALCLIVWSLTLGSASAPDLLLGLAIVLLVLLGLRRDLFTGQPPRPAQLARRTAAFVPFLLAVAWEVAVGTWRVALVVVGLRRSVVSGVILVPMEERSDIGVAVTGLVISLTPGETLLDVDWQQRVMLVHALEVDDPEELRRSQRRLFERFQRPVFP